VTALGKVEHVSDFDGYGSKETLVVAFKLALIEDLNLDDGRFSDGAGKGGEGSGKGKKKQEIRHATVGRFRSSKGLRFS
jgi:hypothetical protein